MKECKDCIHYEACGYHITEETDMSVEDCARGFKDAENYAEIVRCKDCIYAHKLGEGDFLGCSFYRELHKEDDFCNYGKRREG